MADRFSSCGKKVLRDGVHFADCVIPEDAETLATLCNTACRVLAGAIGSTTLTDTLTWTGSRLS